MVKEGCEERKESIRVGLTAVPELVEACYTEGRYYQCPLYLGRVSLHSETATEVAGG